MGFSPETAWDSHYLFRLSFLFQDGTIMTVTVSTSWSSEDSNN